VISNSQVTETIPGTFVLSEPFSSLSLGSSLKRNSYSGFVGIQNLA